MDKGYSITRLDRSHIKAISTLAAAAFYDDPEAVHIIPDDEKRKRLLGYLYEFGVRYGIMYGEGYATSSNLEGFAILLRSEDTEISLWRLMRVGFFPLCRKVGIRIVWRLMYFVLHAALLQDNHLAGRHWRLFLIAVDPPHQGKGCAGALLRHTLNRVDDERLPCYTDTFNEKNVSMYERFGFKLAHSGLVPRTTLNVWALVRTNPA